jgi:hypothetical protein
MFKDELPFCDNRIILSQNLNNQMKTTIARRIQLLAAALCLLTMNAFSQTTLKEYKAGHIFYVSLPDYMKKTSGLNSSSTIQYKNTVKDVYGFIIEDNKEELELSEITYSSLTEFYDEFIGDFLKDEEKRVVSKPKTQVKGAINFIEADVTYYDKEAAMDIYYLVGIVETKSAYYKVLSWTSAANKDKFKADFQKILYSVRD